MDPFSIFIFDVLTSIAKAKPGLLSSLTSARRTDEGVIAAAKSAMTPVPAPAPVPPAPIPAPVPVPPPVPNLGVLPVELAGLRWPAPPVTIREVTVLDHAGLQSAVGVAQTRIRLRAKIQGSVTVRANDVEIIGDAASSVERITVAPGVKRLRVTGGMVGSIELPTPANWNTGSPVYSAALFVEDVTVERVQMVAPAIALAIRGKRIAILDCNVSAQDYCVWAGDTGPLSSEDLIVAGCNLYSAGPQSTLRMHDVLRSAVVGNVMSNPQKHNYRVHGRSDLAFASRNTLVHAGMMLGTEPQDACGTIWFVANVMHHDLPSLLEIVFPSLATQPTIRRLVWSNNTVHTNVWPTAWIYPPPPVGWSVEGNVKHPFTPYLA